MLDGVEWAAAEIVFYMLLATLIGFAIAYVFIRWFQRGSIAEGYEAELAAQQEQTRRAEHRLVESHEALDKVHLELKGEQQRVGKLEAELESVRAAHAELEATAPDESEMAQLQADLESSRSEASDAVRQIAELQAAKSEADEALAERAAAVEKLEQDLAAGRGKADELRTRIAAIEAAKSEADEALAERAAAVEKLEQDLAAERGDSTELRTRVVDLESQLADCVERTSERESPAAYSDTESTAATTADEVAAVVDVPETPEAPAAEAPSQEEGLARIAEIASRTAGDGPTVDDDLKKVHGIGPKLEQTLKGLGITSFRQIANFEADDIAYVTAALDAFKGRIERDDWMGSAAAEHAKKYGEPV